MAERKSVSMQDLADKLGISKVTVSKALNGKDGVGEELKEKIFALARESGYVLPDYGKRKSKKVGIIMSPRFSSGDEGKFYMAMYERIIYELQRASCSSIMISPTTATLPSDMNTIQTRGLFDGLIFLGILASGGRHEDRAAEDQSPRRKDKTSGTLHGRHAALRDGKSGPLHGKPRQQPGKNDR